MQPVSRRPTELFIRRPVLSIVLSLLVLVAGLRAERSLPVQQFLKTVRATIQIQTTYYGADATMVAGFITLPIENAVAAIDGLDTMTSPSQSGQSTITLALRLNQDPNRAMAEVQADVNAAEALLPQGFQPPIITVGSGGGFVTSVDLASPSLSLSQVGDYASRVVIPQPQAIPGVQSATNGVTTKLALRVWFDASRLAGYGLTANDAVTALQNNDLVTGVGQTLGGMTFDVLAINSDLHTVEQFRNLVIRQTGTALIRLGDVANVETGSDTTDVGINTNEGDGGRLHPGQSGAGRQSPRHHQDHRRDRRPLLGGNYVNHFSLQQRSYRVMPLVVRDERLNASQILDYPIARIGGVPAPGVTVDAAYRALQKLARRDLPAGFATDTSGPLREYVTESGSFVPVFGFAIGTVFTLFIVPAVYLALGSHRLPLARTEERAGRAVAAE